MAYLPHLDYDLQRFGPESPQADRAAAELDTAMAPLLDDAQAAGATVIAVAEYGIESANRPVDLNRVLRREGLLEVHVQQGREQLDPWTSRAFAVADHQVAHVYVGDPADLHRTRELGAQPADGLEVGGVVDVDVRDLVVGDGEGARGPGVEVLHAVLGVDLEQPAAAQHPVDVDGLVAGSYTHLTLPTKA